MERYLRLTNIESNEKIEKLTKKVCLLSRCKSNLLRFKPSQIAAGGLILTLSLDSKFKSPKIEAWNQDLEKLGVHNKSDLSEVVEEMKPIFKTLYDN